MNASGCDSRAAALANVGGQGGGATGQAHRADHLHDRFGAVHLATFEPRVEAEVVRFGEEPDGELGADRDVDLALELLARARPRSRRDRVTPAEGGPPARSDR